MLGLTASKFICLFVMLILQTFSSQPVGYGFDARQICNRIEGLVPRQRVICRNHPDAMIAIGEGTRLALEECQYQFKTSRWNCLPQGNTTTINSDPLLIMALPGSRESAFAHAIRSAGITHGIISACSRGEIESCRCDKNRMTDMISEERKVRSVKYDWNRGGCNPDIHFGMHMSRVYADAVETGEESQTLVNLHNNRVGRTTLRKMIKISCRCLGVSGSCTSKTCWMTLPSFREVGDKLSLTYGRASQVEPINVTPDRKQIRLKLRRSPRRRSVETDKKPHPRELVYLKSSPDYCEPDQGSKGTQGRSCNRTSNHMNGCDHLCCGRGYDARIEWKEDKCKCKFNWCCYVTCSTCIKVVESSNCR